MTSRKPKLRRIRRRMADPMAESMASNFSCGHCHSTARATVDAQGFPHVLIGHDACCPVLGGTVSATPDTIRAAIAAGLVGGEK